MAVGVVETDSLRRIADLLTNLAGDLLKVDLLCSDGCLAEKHDLIANENLDSTKKRVSEAYHSSLGGSFHCNLGVGVHANASVEDAV